MLTWPKEFGGQGLGRLENVILNQEEAKFQLPPDIYGIGHGMLGPTIMAHGTQEQKDRFVKEMARGQEVWCQLFSEPAAGSDLAGLRTSAVRDGNDWIINGQKIWSTGAHYCDWGMIVTRTDPNAAEARGPHLLHRRHEVAGRRDPADQADQRRLGLQRGVLHDVRVPDSNRLGARRRRLARRDHDAHERARRDRRRQGAGRVPRSAPARAQTVEAGRQACDRGLGGAPEARRLLHHARRACSTRATARSRALSRGATPGPEGSIGKAVGAPLGQEMAPFASSCRARRAGCSMRTRRPTRAGRRAISASPGIRIAGGTDEILRNIIAERVLRLPPEAAPTRTPPSATSRPAAASRSNSHSRTHGDGRGA